MLHKRINKFIKNPKKALFTLAAPTIIAMLVQTMYNIVDTAFVGRLGADSIAALTFSFPLFFILIALNSGVAVGMGSRISRFLGAKQHKAAENAAIHGLFISICLAALIFIIGTMSLKPLFNIFGATETVAGLAISYMSIILIGVFFMLPSFAMHNIFTAQGDTKTPMKIQVTVLLLNIILDPIFIYVLGYGVKGAAIATVISFAVGLTLYSFNIRKRSHLHIGLSSFNFSPKIIKDILLVGIPASITMIFMSVYLIFINKFAAHFGTEYVASIGIAARLESISIMPIVAISLATLTLIGMFYGAKRYDLIKSIVSYTIKISVAFTSLIGLIFFLLPSIFLRIFTSDQQLINIGSAYLRIEVFTFPLFAIVLIVSRSMQGMGRGSPGLIINLIRIFFIAVPLAYIFIYLLDYGFLSIAVAMVIGALVSAVIATIWIIKILRRIHAI